MQKGYEAIRVSEHVYWVGAIDWNVRDFHGYATKNGTTYNAFLVMADKPTLVDTVRRQFSEEMFSRISSVIDPGDIRYIISNHSEQDHSGSLAIAIERVKPEKIYVSHMGKKALLEIFGIEGVTAVKDCESVSLGNMELTFLETKMLHWPDSMFSYLSGDRLLFSQDAFGMHLATSERFEDQLDFSLLEYEGARYFANILLPFSSLILKLLGRVKDLNLAIDIVAPDHGPVWRKNPEKMIELYSRWASQRSSRKGIIVYDTMWKNTERMASAIAEGLQNQGITAKLMSMSSNHRSDVAYELLDAGALFVGSPTLNNNMLPTIADVLTYIKGLKPKNLVGAAFGSYGWSGESVSQLEDILREMKVGLVAEGIMARNAPDAGTLDACISLGAELKKIWDETLR
ncbi:MAG: FprA family A-type flavoprotein [Syntrophaceae bacterium]|nr:FprA family A-type flavoprotein [Syntrophaceae bacterium]